MDAGANDDSLADGPPVRAGADVQNADDGGADFDPEQGARVGVREEQDQGQENNIVDQGYPPGTARLVDVDADVDEDGGNVVAAYVALVARHPGVSQAAAQDFWRFFLSHANSIATNVTSLPSTFRALQVKACAQARMPLVRQTLHYSEVAGAVVGDEVLQLYR